MAQPLRIALYAPFKPLDHPDPSGDQVIGRGLADFLRSRGHHVFTPSRLRCRWIFLKPWMWPGVVLEQRNAEKACRSERADLWLSHHCYYKAPDLLGPKVCNRLGLPYAVFQGVYSTKRRKRALTRPGFELNRRALLAADLVMANKKVDVENLGRLVPGQKLLYVRPGLDPAAFAPDSQARREVRAAWGVGERPVVLTAAMFRSDVKAESLAHLLRACGRLRRRGRDFLLVLAGDGPERARLEALAEAEVPGAHRFVGRLTRPELARCYAAADVFAFPGLNESLGMVYLEAQAAGLPVAAYAERGPCEAVEPDVTGLLVPSRDEAALAGAVERLLADPALRRAMGLAGQARVGQYFDQNANFLAAEAALLALVRQRG